MRDAKAEIRTAILAARRAVSRQRHEAEARRLAAHLPALVETSSTARSGAAVVICAYVPVGSEPGSTTLVDTLHGLGARVLLPVARRGADGEPQPLRWAEYRPGELVEAPMRLREPSGPALDPDTIRTAALVLVPALAVDRRGVRLGRGAGFYDRSLRMSDPRARLVAVVRDDELVDTLPAEPHDVPMTHALTPHRGVVELGAETGEARSAGITPRK